MVKNFMPFSTDWKLNNNEPVYEQIVGQVKMQIAGGGLRSGDVLPSRREMELTLGYSKGARCLLLDEPFLGTDVFSRRDYLKIMAADLREEETVILSTHLSDEIENFIDRAVILNGGTRKAAADMDKLRKQNQTLEQLLKQTCGYDPAHIQRYL